MKMGELRRDAIFSSGTETFVTPLEPEANGEVTLPLPYGKRGCRRG